MRDKDTDFTPKQAAYDIACGWLEAVVKRRTADLDRFESEAFQRETEKQLRKLHNKLAATQAAQDAGILELDGV